MRDLVVVEAVGETGEPLASWGGDGGMRGGMAWQEGSQGLQCRGPPARVWAVPTQGALGLEPLPARSPLHSGHTDQTAHGPASAQTRAGGRSAYRPPCSLAPGPAFHTLSFGVREGVDGTGHGHACMENPLLNRLPGEPGPTGDSEGPAPEGGSPRTGLCPLRPGLPEDQPTPPSPHTVTSKAAGCPGGQVRLPEGTAPSEDPPAPHVQVPREKPRREVSGLHFAEWGADGGQSGWSPLPGGI